jgi:hypothetical protein
MSQTFPSYDVAFGTKSRYIQTQVTYYSLKIPTAFQNMKGEKAHVFYDTDQSLSADEV